MSPTESCGGWRRWSCGRGCTSQRLLDGCRSWWSDACIGASRASRSSQLIARNLSCIDDADQLTLVVDDPGHQESGAPETEPLNVLTRRGCRGAAEDLAAATIGAHRPARMTCIKIENLNKRFDKQAVLQQLSLVIEEGSFFTLLGPSGCGKTTLLRCIAGFHVPESGRILFDSDDLTAVHMGMTQGLLAAMVADTAPDELRGTAYGLFNLLSGLALLLSSVIAGLLWDTMGSAFTLYAGAGFAALTLLGMAMRPAPKRQPAA